MDGMAGGGPRETPDEQPAAEDDAGTLVHESGQDVVVHGNGGIQEMLKELDDIAFKTLNKEFRIKREGIKGRGSLKHLMSRWRKGTLDRILN